MSYIMTFWRDGMLIAVSVGCLIAGGFPQRSKWIDPATGDRFSECRLGLWFSPAFQHIRRDYQRVSGSGVQGGYHGSGTIHWLSWSMLLVLLGAAGLTNVRWRSERQGSRERRGG